jgi:hypothetical protein
MDFSVSDGIQQFPVVSPRRPRFAHIIAHRAAPFKPTYLIEEWQKNLGQRNG